MSHVLSLLQRALSGAPLEDSRFTFPPPVQATVGFELVSVERGAAVFRLDARRERHANPTGTVHGGIFADVADAAMGIACASLLEDGESFTTLELKMNFFRPVVDGLVEARAKVVNGGKTVVYLECDLVLVPSEKLVARSSSTCLVLRGEQAKGR